VTEKGLQMRVDVDFFIFWILVEVETGRVYNVSVCKFQGHFVATLAKKFPREFNSVSIKLYVADLIIYAHLTNFFALKF